MTRLTIPNNYNEYHLISRLRTKNTAKLEQDLKNKENS